jgi:hypothetical protein
MQRTEIAVIGIMFGAVPVIAGFLAGWWISIPLVPESRIFLCALAGLFMGLIIDIILLRGWIHHAYSMKPYVWMAVYHFYSIGMFGFFMGVPVFNVLLALPAGFFVGGWGAHHGADVTRMREAARRCAVFTTSVLALVCVASASIALASPSTASDLQGMLRLPFRVTLAMIIGIILSGGALILSFQWWLTIRCAEGAYGFFIARANASTPHPGRSSFIG